MSEYQYVEFRAVDRPLNDKELAFANRQSSRADVSRWSLSCEYDYSYFRGDVDGLLRRGYDVSLQYTNYGDREIKMRLPHGLPFSKKVWSKYVVLESLEWKKDSKGSGGILSLCPFHEPGELEPVWEFDEYLDAAIQVRKQIMAGDLRGLYLLWLCAVQAVDAGQFGDGPSEKEPPVPHGLADSPETTNHLLQFYDLDPLLLDAAGQGLSAGPVDEPLDQLMRRWVKSLKSGRAKEVLCELLTGDATALKTTLLAEIRDSQPPVIWPTTDMQRTFFELIEQADALRLKANAKQARKDQAKAKRDAAKAERERQTRMKTMAKDPQRWLNEASRLAKARGTVNYKAAADILFDLREAIGNEKGDKIARQHAAHLAKKHPTLKHLKSSLRKRGLVE